MDQGKSDHDRPLMPPPPLMNAGPVDFTEFESDTDADADDDADESEVPSVARGGQQQWDGDLSTLNGYIHKNNDDATVSEKNCTCVNKSETGSSIHSGSCSSNNSNNKSGSVSWTSSTTSTSTVSENNSITLNKKKNPVGRPRNPKPDKKLARKWKLVDEKAAVLVAQDVMARDSNEGSKMAIQTLSTTWGRKAFPALWNVVKEQESNARFKESSISAMACAGSAHRRELIGMHAPLLSRQDKQDAARAMTCTSGHFNRMVRESAKLPPGRIQREERQPGLSRTGTSSHLRGIVLKFFEGITCVLSGACTIKRVLGLPLWQVGVDFYAQYPVLLRTFADENPNVVEDIVANKPTNRFERSLLASQREEPVSDRAIEARRMDAKLKYTLHLKAKELRSRHYSNQQVKLLLKSQENKEQVKRILKSQETIAEDENTLCDDAADTAEAFHVPHPQTFWQIIKDAAIRWTSNANPTECPLHDKGPAWQEQEKDASKKCAAALTRAQDAKRALGQAAIAEDTRNRLKSDCKKETATWWEYVQQLRKLRADLARYARHLLQYKQCRPIIQKIESRLQPGQAVVYRDFVAQYNCDGEKVANLVLVVIWNAVVNGVSSKQVFKLNHFCSAKKERSQDAYYVAAVFDFHFGKGGKHSAFFKNQNITTIFLSGDHGSHFSSIQTIYNESCFFEEYGIEVHLFFLCSYHAFNRCDAAGCEGKTLNKQMASDRKGLRRGAEFAGALNDSNYSNSYGWDMEGGIERQDSIVFPVPLVSDKTLDLRRKCEVRFYWEDEKGKRQRERGVVLVREVPELPSEFGSLESVREVTPYQFFDLRQEPPDGCLCRPCSNSSQRVVRHGKVSCPLAGIADSVKQELRDENLAGPCKYRSVDVYPNEKLDDDFVSPMRKDVGAFPCRVKVQSTYTLHLKDLSHTLYTCNPPHIGMPENALRVVLHCQRTHEKKALSGCYRRAPVPKRQEQERVADISVPGGPLCHRTMSVQQTYEIQERRSRQ